MYFIVFVLFNVSFHMSFIIIIYLHSPLLNSNFTHNFQESLCADDRLVQHEYPLLFRLKCTGPLSLLQYYLQSNIRPLSTKINTESLTQLLVFMDSSIFCQLSVGGCSQTTYQILFDVTPANLDQPHECWQWSRGAN